MGADEPTRVEPAVLDYASPRPPRWPKLRATLQTLREWGPWVPRVSWVTGLFLLICAATSWLLAARPPAWRYSRSDAVWASGTRDESAGVLYLRKSDAVFAAGPDGQLRIWRPWTGETILRIGDRTGGVSWLNTSADESKLMAQTQNGTFICDAHTGAKLAKLTWGPDIYLGPQVVRNGMITGALSADGSRLVMLDQELQLMLWDMTGPKGELLASTSKPNNSRWDARVRFSPDDRRVLLRDMDRLWLGDAKTLQPVLQTAGETWVFLDGGRKLLVAQRRNSATGGALCLYDAESGAKEREWTAFWPTRIAVSPDDRRVVVGSSMGFGLSLDRATGQTAQTLPSNLSAWSDMQFFPDARRLIVSRVWGQEPGVIDMQTGRHVANLHLPRTPGQRWNVLPPVRRVILSRDGKHAAVVMYDGQMHVYQHVGEESRWGVFASGNFWLLAAAVALLVGSLSRDAWRTRPGPIPTMRVIAASLLICAGGVALVCPFVWAALGLWDLYTWWYNDGWVVWLFVLYLWCGLGLIMRSRAWGVLTAIALVVSALISLPYMATSFEYANRPERIFDRMWMLPPSAMAAASAAWGLLSVAVLIVLGKSKLHNVINAIAVEAAK